MQKSTRSQPSNDANRAEHSVGKEAVEQLIHKVYESRKAIGQAERVMIEQTLHMGESLCAIKGECISDNRDWESIVQEKLSMHSQIANHLMVLWRACLLSPWSAS